jgi:dienelactone hydrolase
MRALMAGALAEAKRRGADTTNAVAMGYCFGGAPLALTVWGGDRYRESADKKSWARFTAFLKTTLKNG